MRSFLNIGARFWLIGLMGVIIGCVSAWLYTYGTHFTAPEMLSLIGSYAVEPSKTIIAISLADYAPGLLFGLAVALVYFIYSEQKMSVRAFGAAAITIQGIICYQIAFLITYTLTLSTVPYIPIPMWVSIPFVHSQIAMQVSLYSFLGGYVATLIFLCLLQVLTKKFSAMKLFALSLCGGVFGALLIIITLSVDTANPDPYRLSHLAYLAMSAGKTLGEWYTFFISWQTVMLLLISRALSGREAVQPTAPTAPAPSPSVTSAPVTVANKSSLMRFALVFLMILIAFFALIPVWFMYYQARVAS